MIEDFSLDKEFDEEMDLTPLIDVVFILLIFFFITSTFIRPSMPVHLSSAESAVALAERKEQLVITIDAAGSIYAEGQLASRDELPALLRAAPPGGINLMVDRAAPFDAFVAVADAARRVQREDLTISTLPGGRE